MQKTQQIAAIAIVALAGLTAYGFWETRQPLTPVAKVGTNPSTPSNKSLVDQSSMNTAKRLAQLATSQEERAFAQEALRAADYAVDLEFASALDEARRNPPPLSAEAKDSQEHLQKAEKLLAADQERAKQLAELGAKASGDKKDSIEMDLVQTEASLDLDQDEVDDAKRDFLQAGGDVGERIQAMKEEHDRTAHDTPAALAPLPASEDQVGLIHRAQQWFALHQKQLQLGAAKDEAAGAKARLSAQHNALEAELDAAKSSLPGLAIHSKKAKAEAAAGAVSTSSTSREESETLLKKTEQITAQQKRLAGFDKRVEAQDDLVSVYGQWSAFVAAHQRAVVHRALFGIAVILTIALIALFFGSWMDTLVKRLSMDRRQVQSLHTVTRVGLQILALFLILLVIFGPPGQLGTFLGLAGAGLTVALKDFIVGFIGWFVLMGRNGMRVGDWVEINGVTGEVVQIGPFHTVLMETGNWTDSGHPTGRRVTFTNSFAIEGHYFNFSTSGQWLWDELQIVLPAGQDPYPLIDAIHKKVIEATRESAEEAEREWRGAATSRELSGISVAPAVSVKPVVGGVEVAVRYITKASERYQLRSKLNQAAVELLGGRAERVTS
ncbi:MAG: mechanosensitive ion channel domain-containing protein [Candidatus Acidiferrum sp.]